MLPPTRYICPCGELRLHKISTEELERNGQHREAITAILGLESSYHTAVRQMIKENTTEKKPVLTEREQEIANLAAQGAC